jgi:putative transposase
LVLGVSANGYRKYLQRRSLSNASSGGRVTDMALLAYIRAIHAETRGAYGWPRMWRELQSRGVRAGKERVRKMMKENDIRARAKRKFKATTDGNHNLPVCENPLNRNFKPERPDTVWTGDIAHIPTNEGWLYLAVVIDAFSRQLVASLALRARLGDGRTHDPAARHRRAHPDRGSRYASADFRKPLKRYGMRGSMSRKGDRWDNAVTETLFRSLKVERLHGMMFETRRAAMDEVVDWLVFYNRKRLHSTLGYKSPMAFEEIWRRQRQTLAA